MFIMQMLAVELVIGQLSNSYPISHLQSRNFRQVQAPTDDDKVYEF